MVKETFREISEMNDVVNNVSIPSRGSGKGDFYGLRLLHMKKLEVSIPSRGSGKGDTWYIIGMVVYPLWVSIPSRGSGKGDPLL